MSPTSHHPTLMLLRTLAHDSLTYDPRPSWLIEEESRASRFSYPRTYYRLFYEVTRRLQCREVVEIGTETGLGALHLAAGNPAASVLTIDVDSNATARADAYRRIAPNLRAVTSDSTEYARRNSIGPLDLLFIDGDHGYEQAYRDFLEFSRFVRPGGIVFVDDIHLSKDMERMWREVNVGGIELPDLHYSGFGAIVNLPSDTLS